MNIFPTTLAAGHAASRIFLRGIKVAQRAVVPLFALWSSALSHAQTIPDSLWIKESAIVHWDYEDSLDGWTQASSSVTDPRSENGCLRGSSVGTDPNFSVPSQKLQMRDAAGVVVRVWFSQASSLQLYWSNEDGGFGESRMAQQMVPAQQWTTVKLNLSTHPQWAGKTIQGLRVDPGTAVGLTFAIDYLGVVAQLEDRDGSLATKTYDFNSDAQNWTLASAHVSGFRWEDGKLKGSSISIDPNLTGPAFSFANQGGVAVQVKSNINGTFAIYWATTEGGFTQTRTASMPVTNEGWQTLWFDLRSYPTWAGKTITKLRLDPSSIAGQDFEIDSVILLKSQAFENTDGDRLVTFAEAIHLTDPLTPSFLRGRLAMETWAPTTHYSTRSLVEDAIFYSAPGTMSFLNQSTTGQQPGTYYSTRIRGYILAPSTGYYRFWVSGRNGVELYLSQDESKYRKRRIAEINPDLGDGHGIPFGDLNLWDQTTSQMSASIYLEQGQAYFFETLQSVGHAGNSHVSLAWAPPGSGRAPLPSSCLRSYAFESADADDDYLPDAWEQEYGLDTANNGYADILKQGDRGDFDNDGLSNRDEYLLGSNPADSDTDGDGESDGDEVNALGSDVLVANAITDTLLSEVAIDGFATSSTGWTMTTGGLLADSYRGEVSWDFSVPSDGNWLIRLDMEILGTTYGNEVVPVVIKVDGVPVTRQNVRFGLAKRGLMQALTPWLAAGTHRVTAFVDNEIARRTVRLVSLKIYAPANSASVLARDNRLIAHSTNSRTSPAFIEGFARNVNSVTINGSPAVNGTGGGHWFGNVTLANDSVPQSYSLVYEQGWGTTGTLIWQATNVMDGETLTIRQGDSLRVGAWNADLMQTSVVTLSSGGSWSNTGDLTTIIPFNTPGAFTINGLLQNGNTANLVVKVIPAPGFSSEIIDVLKNAMRTLSIPAAEEVGFSVSEKLASLVTVRNGPNTNVTILASSAEEFGVAARLFGGGPILAVQRVNTICVADALQNDMTTSGISSIAGYKLLNTPMTVLNLPPGGRIDVRIVRAGVMFPNGTTLRSIFPADVVNGVVNLEFLFPLGQAGGYCHSLLVYDRNGVLVGTR